MKGTPPTHISRNSTRFSAEAAVAYRSMGLISRLKSASSCRASCAHALVTSSLPGEDPQSQRQDGAKIYSRGGLVADARIKNSRRRRSQQSDTLCLRILAL